MARGHQIPLYYIPVALVEELVDMKGRHRADGVLSSDEDRLEQSFLTSRVLVAVMDNAEAADFASTVARYGFGSDSTQRKWRRSLRRSADLVIASARRSIQRLMADEAPVDLDRSA